MSWVTSDSHAMFLVDVKDEEGNIVHKISPYANTVNGQLVDHITAKAMYDIGLLDEKDI